MQRHSRTSRRPSSSFRWLWWLVGLILVSGVVLVLLAPSLVTGYIRSYLRKAEFRQKAEDMITAKLGGKANIAPIIWNDDIASVTDLSLETASGWNVDAGGMHLALDFGAIRQGSWSIQNTGADDLTLRLTTTAPMASPAASGPERLDPMADAGSIPSFLRRYIPSETKVSGFDVHRFFFEQGAWKIAGTQLRLGSWKSGETSVSARLNGGTLQTPITAPEQKEPLKLDLAQATLRLGEKQLQLSDATLRWKQDSEATLRGSLKVETGAWQTFTHVKAVPLDEFLDPVWKQRLSGKIEGDLEVAGTRNAPPTWRADALLKDGVLTGLPILEKLVTYTNTHRFKRLVLDICSASFSAQGDSLRIENIIVQSNGLLRIEGSLTIRGRMVDGDFMLGVTPETVRGIPGANSRVFVGNNPAGPPGLQWTRVRIAGTLDSPQEDLSTRLIGAAGMSLLFDTPGSLVGKGAETLLKPVLGEGAAQMPGKVIEGTSGVIENTVKAGTGIINKVLPIFPRK
ncbi:hypothetical protein [Prosthecobacter sp.]|uniref:hypothetical protein n=1 Tax=Prosthecobacter sp. TaxID=1965333 RepID=UPI002AB84278|nr:hypothetical protein [Prosthecobacter sp.]MDZ4404468.1 hypothetical protein [Prosthecobacter sp.]